jgi:hypothetical protein
MHGNGEKLETFTAVVYRDTTLLVAGTLIKSTLNMHALADWNGQVEISRRVDTLEDGAVRVGEGYDGDHTWLTPPFWTVYLHQNAGGVDRIADLYSKDQAEVFAAALSVYRNWQLIFKAR